jgi:hypothetical protein
MTGKSCPEYPPAVEVIVEKTEGFPLLPVEGFPVPRGPPPPTVIV